MLESKLLANLNLLNQRAFQLIVFQEDDCFKSLLDLQQVYEVSKKLLERQTCFNKNTFQAEALLAKRGFDTNGFSQSIKEFNEPRKPLKVIALQGYLQFKKEEAMRQTSDKSDYLSRNYVQTLSQELLDRYYSKEFARLSCKTESLVCQELLGFPFRNQLAVDPQLVTDFMRKYGKGVVELNRYSLAAGYSRAFDALDYQQVIEGFVEVKKKLYLNSKSSEDRHMLSCLNLVRFITLHHNDFEGRLLYLEKQFFCFLANCNQSLNENKEENIDRYLFSLGLSETDGQFAYAKYFYLLRSGCYRDPQCDGSLDELRRRFPRNLTKPWHRKQWDGYQRVVANIIGNNSAFAEYPYEIFKTVEDVLWLRLYLFRTGIVDTRRLCLPFNEVKRMLTENSFSSVKELQILFFSGYYERAVAHLLGIAERFDDGVHLAIALKCAGLLFETDTTSNLFERHKNIEKLNFELLICQYARLVASDDITTCLHYQFLLPRSKFLEEVKQLIQTLEYSDLCILFGAPSKGTPGVLTTEFGLSWREVADLLVHCSEEEATEKTLAIAALASHYFQLSGEEKQMLFYKKKTLRLVTAMCNRALDGDLLILATYPGGALELREKIKDVLFLDSYRDDYFKEEFELLLFYGDVLQFYDLHFKGLHHEAYAKFKCLDLQDWEFSRNAFRKFPNLILAFMRTLHFLSSNNPNRLYQEKLNQEVKDLFEYCTTADVDLSKVGSTLVRLENQINCKTKNY